MCKIAMKKILNYIELLPDWSKVMGCLLLSLLLGGVDYITGDLSIAVFYFFPISLASWFIGKRIGFFISVLCGMELFITDELVSSAHVTVLNIRTWNSLMEVGFLLLSGYLVFRFRSEMVLRRQKSIELQASNQDLEAFNYTVAHDLRQPLNVIGLSYQAIKELYGDQLQAECMGYIQEAYDSSLRMNELIEALLKFSRMGHVEPNREKVFLSKMAQEVASMLKQTKPERQVDFQITDGIVANGDASLLRVVLDNLLSNAWKYTGMQEKAVIEFGTSEIDGKPVYFVRDNGAGFDKADANALFMPFQRLPGAEEFKGSGIGLATVERIIQRHGGRIWAEGELGKGATFWFTLQA